MALGTNTGVIIYNNYWSGNYLKYYKITYYFGYMHPDISSWLGGANTPSGTITGAEALAVDTKIDDTFANTGNVLQGFFTSAACGAGGATYPVSNSAPVCTLAINMLATSNIQDQ